MAAYVIFFQRCVSLKKLMFLRRNIPKGALNNLHHPWNTNGAYFIHLLNVLARRARHSQLDCHADIVSNI
jgi:hypothetical protein